MASKMLKSPSRAASQTPTPRHELTRPAVQFDDMRDIAVSIEGEIVTKISDLFRQRCT
jgi:hypothetical protein